MSDGDTKTSEIFAIVVVESTVRVDLNGGQQFADGGDEQVKFAKLKSNILFGSEMIAVKVSRTIVAVLDVR